MHGRPSAGMQATAGGAGADRDSSMKKRLLREQEALDNAVMLPGF